MQKLVQGVHHFQKDVFTHQKDLFEKLSGGQKPDALLITCSDSRIDPNLLTQTEPGELFILRNAGNIVPPYQAVSGGEDATIEYAIAALGIRHIIVCGHSHCGAMGGLLKPEAVATLPAVQKWLTHAERTLRVVRENYAELAGEALLTATVQENVLTQLENLTSHPVVAEGVARGEVHLHGWVYKFETGEVFAYDAEQEQFAPLGKNATPVSLEALPSS